MSTPEPRSVPAAPSLASLLIEDGGQAGAEIALAAAGPHRIGAGLDADVVVFDPALADLHFTIALAPSPVLRAEEGELLLADGRRLAPGEAAGAAASLRFRAGATGFCLRLPAPPAPPRRARAPGLALAALCGLVALAGLAHSALPHTETAILAGRGVRPAPVAARVPAGAAPAAASVQKAALAALSGRLEAAGLRGIDLIALPDGPIAAQGRIAPGQQAAWRDLQRWFDGAYGARLVLVDRVSAAGLPPPLAIESVWTGRFPYVIDGDGEKLFVGAVLRDGWTLDAIAPDRVLLRRGGQTLALRF